MIQIYVYLNVFITGFYAYICGCSTYEFTMMKTRIRVIKKPWLLHLEGFFKHGLLGPTPRVSDWISLQWGLRICISNMMLLKLGTGPHFENYWPVNLVIPHTWCSLLLTTALTNRYYYSHFIQVDTETQKTKEVTQTHSIDVRRKKQKGILLWYWFFDIPSLISGIILILYLIMLYFWKSFAIYIISFIIYSKCYIYVWQVSSFFIHEWDTVYELSKTLKYIIIDRTLVQIRCGLHLYYLF